MLPLHFASLPVCQSWWHCDKPFRKCSFQQTVIPPAGSAGKTAQDSECERATKYERTHRGADEVGVETHAIAPQVHQLRGGKLFSHQSSDGFTAAALHHGEKVLHHAAARCVLCGKTDWLHTFRLSHRHHSPPSHSILPGPPIQMSESSPPNSFSRPLQDPPSKPADT